MIRFKLRKRNHERLTKVVGYLCLGGWMCLIGIAIYSSIDMRQRINRLNQDPIVVEAALSLDGVKESYRRRTGTTSTFRFHYTFEVDGTQYEKTFETSESNADKYLGKDSIEIVFSRTTGEFAKASELQKDTSILGIIWDVIVAMFISALLLLIMFIYLTAMLFVVRPQDIEPEDDDDEAATADAVPPAKA